jgi:hypothetical protein
VPVELFAVVIETPVTGALDAVVAGDELAAGLAVELELLLPHAATTTATPTSAISPHTRDQLAVRVPMIRLLRVHSPEYPCTNKDTRGAPILPDRFGETSSRHAAAKTVYAVALAALSSAVTSRPHDWAASDWSASDRMTDSSTG